MRSGVAIDEQGLAAARAAQALRNGIIQLLPHPQFCEILQGAFVRVLVELPNRNEDYLIARVAGVEEGETYTGYSQNVTHSTNYYLRLGLPRTFATASGQLYQLNSISNSPMTREELLMWVENIGGAMPPTEELDRVAAGLRGPVPARLETTARASVPENQGTTMGRRPTREIRAGAEEPLPTRDQLRHVVLEELRQHHFMVPLHAADLKISQLRIVERDLIEYLERVRDTIMSSRPNCVVCMDRIPTVITLPCKHRVLCRLCAAQVRSCPVCRQTVTELFEPVEI